MKTTIAKFRADLSKYIGKVQSGHEIELQKHATTVAKLVPAKLVKTHTTKLGAGVGSVSIKGDLTKPMTKINEWHMLSKKRKGL